VNGELLTDIKQLQPAMEIETVLENARVISTVKKIKAHG